MKRLSKTVAGILFGWLVVTAGAQAAETPEIFQDFNGQVRTVESFAGSGKWLVVMMWAHDCHVCNVEVEEYAHFHEAHKDKDATVLGISIDGQGQKAKAEDFIRRHDVPFPNLIGEAHTSMLWYLMQTGAQFAGTPTIMVYGPDGKLMAAQAGAVPPEIIEDFMAKNPATAAN